MTTLNGVQKNNKQHFFFYVCSLGVPVPGRASQRLQDLGVNSKASKAQVAAERFPACWAPILNVSFCLKCLYHIPNVTGIVREMN